MELLDQEDLYLKDQYEYALSIIEETYRLQIEKIEEDCEELEIGEYFKDKDKFLKFRHIYNTYMKKGIVNFF